MILTEKNELLQTEAGEPLVAESPRALTLDAAGSVLTLNVGGDQLLVFDPRTAVTIKGA